MGRMQLSNRGGFQHVCRPGICPMYAKGTRLLHKGSLQDEVKSQSYAVNKLLSKAHAPKENYVTGGQGHAPEKMGCSRGPVQCRTPRTAPATGNGGGRTARVRRNSFRSMGATVALKRYRPVSGFRSMSPGRPLDAQRESNTYSYG